MARTKTRTKQTTTSGTVSEYIWIPLTIPASFRR
jgi:hypothetical protein